MMLNFNGRQIFAESAEDFLRQIHQGQGRDKRDDQDYNFGWESEEGSDHRSREWNKAIRFCEDQFGEEETEKAAEAVQNEKVPDDDYDYD